MRHTLTVAAREIREYSFLFIAAGVLAVIPLLTMLLRTPLESRMEAVAILGLGVAANFAIVVALMVGATIVGREISEHRTSFYFSRPVPASAIWFGKLTAAVLMTLAAFALIVVPSAIVAGDQWRRVWPFTAGASVGFAVL